MPDLVLVEARKPILAQILGTKADLAAGQRATIDRALARNLSADGSVFVVNTSAVVSRRVAALEGDFRISAKRRKINFDVEESRLRAAFDAKIATIRLSVDGGEKPKAKVKAKAKAKAKN